MAKNRLPLKMMRDSIEGIIELQPYHVQHWVIVGGDGMTNDLSYTISYSYVAAFADLGKQVFSNFYSPVADTSQKNFVIVSTFFNDLAEPSRNEIIYLYDLAGTSLGRFKINFVQSYFVGSIGSTNRAKFKTEIHVLRLEA